MTVVYRGKIDSDFDGFDDSAIFKMANGTYWIQAEYHYWYHYAYRPDAIITEENGRFILNVADHSIEIIRLNSVIESRINGEFTGWDGNKQYKLVNGQTWEQARYKYQYKYAYRPEAVVCDVGGGHLMFVKGTKAFVRRIK